MRPRNEELAIPTCLPPRRPPPWTRWQGNAPQISRKYWSVKKGRSPREAHGIRIGILGGTNIVEERARARGGEFLECR